MDDGQLVFQSKKRGPFADLLPWQWILLFAVTGIFAFQYPGAGITACSILAGLMFCNGRLSLNLLWVPAIFCLGLGWAWLHAPTSQPTMQKWMEQRKKANVQAKVHAVRFKPENRIQIILDNVYCKGEGFEQVLPGMTVWTWQDPSMIPAPGQNVKAFLRMKPIDGFDNFHTWNSRDYWSRQGIIHRSFTKGDTDPPVRITGQPGFLWKWRLKLRFKILEATKPGPGQGLLLALLMADRSQLEYQTLDLVNRASLTHSLALSGLHLGFIISLGWAAAWGIGRFWPRIFLVLPRPMVAIILGVPLVIAYLWLGQGRDSLLRAALMFFFWVLLLLTGRSKAILDGLFFALLVFLLWDPLSVFSLGWQLSMVAVAGILILWPVFGPRLSPQRSKGKKMLWFFGSILLLSLIANAALLPLIMYYFGQISPHIYLNVLWLPVLGFCILPLGLLGMVCSVLPGLELIGQKALFLSGFFLDQLNGLLEWLNDHGWLEVLVTPRPGWLECLGYWLILGGLVSGVQAKQGKNFAVAGLGGILLLGPWLAASVPWSGEAFHLQVLDVGQGQAVCLHGPQGERTLIDGGGSWNPDFDLGRFAVSPALTYRALPRVETVVLSHPDFDHLRGLFFILDHYWVKRFVYNGQWPSGQDGRTLKQIIQSRGIPVRKVQAGDTIKIGARLWMDVLHPGHDFHVGNDNDRSLVLRVRHREHGLALIPGDIEKKGIAALIESGKDMQADLLVVPHHGSRGSLSHDFYDMVDPQLVVVSCGFLNIFRFPHETVEKALQESNIPLYCTSQSGEIQVRWDFCTMDIASIQTRLD
jgi:competence protein ComEC